MIAKRSEKEKAFPGKWTVPGGKLEVLDYALRLKDTTHHWYNVLEDLAKREVWEEVGLNYFGVTLGKYLRLQRRQIKSRLTAKEGKIQKTA